MFKTSSIHSSKSESSANNGATRSFRKMVAGGTRERTEAKVISDLWRRIKIGLPEECWPWIGPSADKRPLHNYGRFWLKNKAYYAHRAVFEVHYGSIPDGMDILHKCDNPPCCNPNHLYAGTMVDNMADMHKKGRANRERGEQRYNAKLTPEKVSAIKKARESGMSFSKIAREFDVSQTAIFNVIKGIRWKHIQ